MSSDRPHGFNVHKMTVFVLEMHFCKLPPKVISYRDFKSLKMKVLWIPYIWLQIVKILITLKIQTYFLIYDRVN